MVRVRPRKSLPRHHTCLARRSLNSSVYNTMDRAYVCGSGFCGPNEVARRKQQLMEAIRADEDWEASNSQEEPLVLQYNDPFSARMAWLERASRPFALSSALAAWCEVALSPACFLCSTRLSAQRRRGLAGMRWRCRCEREQREGF